MEIISLNSLTSLEMKKKLISIINNIIEKHTWTQSEGAPRSAERTVGENPTQVKPSQRPGTDHYAA